MPIELHGTELSHTGVESMKIMHVSSILLLAAGSALSPASASTSCVSYGRTAVDQVKRASLGACGYTGPRWSTSVREHRQWCERQKDRSARVAEEAAREARLRHCKAPAVSTPLFR
jgi:hypothetical protein